MVGFDLDMTLVDSRPGIAATLAELARETGAPVATDEMLDALLRRNLDLEFGERFKPRSPRVGPTASATSTQCTACLAPPLLGRTRG